MAETVYDDGTIFDDRPSETIPLQPQKRTAVIRTSDRIAFKRCRRRWGWSSHLRGNLGSRTAISPLWLGSGFHFALEDMHGVRRYPSAAIAFDAYVYATRKKGGIDALPIDYRTDWDLARGMLDYYEHMWLSNRDPLDTFVHNGIPQVEVNFRILIPFDAKAYGYDEVVYSGTLDRVAIDSQGILWIVEYKTAKRIVTHHFQTDPQVTAYCWAASVLYPGFPIGGVIYQQHRKDVPADAKILASGKISTDKRQATTYHSYRKAVVNLYGEVLRAPGEVVDTLNYFAELEQHEYNHFVRRDRLYRNEHQIQAEGEKILLELDDMLNPDSPLYPNPTRECSICNFIGPCVSMDDGSDYEMELDIFNTPRESYYDSWRDYLPDPKDLVQGSNNEDNNVFFS